MKYRFVYVFITTQNSPYSSPRAPAPSPAPDLVLRISGTKEGGFGPSRHTLYRVVTGNLPSTEGFVYVKKN